MSNEFGENLYQQLMEDHWRRVFEKPYRLFGEVWQIRDILPISVTADFDSKIREPLKVPLKGDCYIKLGVEGSIDRSISLDLRFANSRGEIMEAGTIIVKEWDPDNDHDFWIDYDGVGDNELIKALGRIDPEKDIDWEKLDKNTTEYEIALAMCRGYLSDRSSR